MRWPEWNGRPSSRHRRPHRSSHTRRLDGWRQRPPAIELAIEPRVVQQHGRHVLGDWPRRAGQPARVRDQRHRSAGPAASRSAARPRVSSTGRIQYRALTCEGIHKAMPKHIADSTVRRLSLYLRFVEEALERGRHTMSSDALAELSGTTSAQVRKDLSALRLLRQTRPRLPESGTGHAHPRILGLGRESAGRHHRRRPALAPPSPSTPASSSTASRSWACMTTIRPRSVELGWPADPRHRQSAARRGAREAGHRRPGHSRRNSAGDGRPGGARGAARGLNFAPTPLRVPDTVTVEDREHGVGAGGLVLRVGPQARDPRELPGAQGFRPPLNGNVRRRKQCLGLRRRPPQRPQDAPHLASVEGQRPPPPIVKPLGGDDRIETAGSRAVRPSPRSAVAQRLRVAP